MNTKLLPLLAQSAEGTAIFKTFSGVKRTGSDETGIQLDVILYWPIRTSHEAEELNPVIAGASAMYADRDSRDEDDPAKSDYSVTRKFQDDARHLTLNLIQDGGEGGGRVILSDQICSVISATVKTSKKAASYEAKVRLFGLTPKQVGDLAEGLTSHVGISLEMDQASLFGDKKDNVVHLRTSIAPKLGQIASGRLTSGADFTGIVTEITDDGVVGIKDLDGSEMEVAANQITSALTVVPPRGKTMEWVEETYQKKAEKKGNVATWAAVVSALGEVHAGNLTPTETWSLTSSILDAAAKISGATPMLGDEDEEDEGAEGDTPAVVG